jgi:hypothetical protein
MRSKADSSGDGTVYPDFFHFLVFFLAIFRMSANYSMRHVNNPFNNSVSSTSEAFAKIPKTPRLSSSKKTCHLTPLNQSTGPANAEEEV